MIIQTNRNVALHFFPRFYSKISFRGFVHLRESLTSTPKKPCLLKEERKEKNRSDLGNGGIFFLQKQKEVDASCW